MSEIGRTRFKKDIVAEYIPPARTLKNERVIIFANGMPSVPRKEEMLRFWSQKNYWTFFPRYRGTWESDGEFLAEDPTKDVLDVVDHVSRLAFRDIFSGTDIEVQPAEIHVIGSSFGGPAALFSSHDSRVTSATALSPVIDWRAEVHNKAEPLDWLAHIVREAFGNGYRFSNKNWNKLQKGNFYNPATSPDQIAAEKCQIVHATDDEVVALEPIKDFCTNTNMKAVFRNKGGHFGLSATVDLQIYEHIRNHISSSRTRAQN